MKYDKATSNKILEQIKANPDKLQKQVEGEYKKGHAHVLAQRTKKRNVHTKLLEQPKKVGHIKSRLLWRYMKIWMSLNVLDGIIVDFTPMGGVDSAEVGNNANKVAAFDYKAMKMFNIDFLIKWDIGLLGLGVKLLPGWDKLGKHPKASHVDPLTIIPDPQNWMGSDMRWIGFEKRMNIHYMTKADGYFNVDEIKHFSKVQLSDEIEQNLQAVQNAGDYEVDLNPEGVGDVYFHYVTHNGRKYLTGWMNSRKVLVYLHELKPKTKAEKADPRKIQYPVELFRGDPIPKHFFGASLWDQIGQYQDVETILDNLEIVIARKNAMGEDKIINSSMIDIKNFHKKRIGGRIIPAKLENGERISDSIYNIPQDNPNQYPQYINEKTKQKPAEVTGFSNLAFGISPDGSQTKGEIQALQENLNSFLSYTKLLLMHSEISFWEKWYTFYVYNLSGSSVKHIAITKGSGPADLFDFKKKDFILDVPVIVEVKSKSEEKVKKEKLFARMQMVMGTILPNLPKDSHPYNEMLRRYMEYGGIERDDVMKYVGYSEVEMDALGGLELLNNGEKPRSPRPEDDHRSFIMIYSLSSDNTGVKRDIIEEYLEAAAIKKKMEAEAALAPAPVEGGEVDATAKGQVGNMIAQEAASDMPSITDI